MILIKDHNYDDGKKEEAVETKKKEQIIKIGSLIIISLRSIFHINPDGV